jgi:hypothetical protein
MCELAHSASVLNSGILPSLVTPFSHFKMIVDSAKTAHPLSKTRQLL